MLLLTLPDDILCANILAQLSFKEIDKLHRAVCSSRWKSRWLNILRTSLQCLLHMRPVSDRDIRWISRYVTVRSVQIARNRFSDMCVANIAYNCPRIQSLTLNGMDQGYFVCSTTIMMLAQRCTFLKCISLSNLSSVRDCAIVAIATHCCALETLDMHGCSEVTDVAIVALAVNCSQLRKLDICACTKVSDHGITALGRQCHRLNEIYCEGCSRINEAAFSILVTMRGSNLLRLNCNFCSTSNDLAKDIALSCQQLKLLHICNCNTLTDDVLCSIAKSCPALENVDIDYCTQISDAGVIGLAKRCSNLTSLSVQYCSLIADEGVVALALHCHDLKIFLASGNFGITSDGIVAFVRRHVNIKQLAIGACSVSDEAVLAIAKFCPLLENLELFGNVRITDTGVSSLVSCSRLRVLRASGCERLTDISIMCLLHSCPSLEVISLPRDGGITLKCFVTLQQHREIVVELK